MPKIELFDTREFTHTPSKSQIQNLNQAFIDNGINEYETRSDIRIIFSRYVVVRATLARQRYVQENTDSEWEETRARNQVMIYSALAEEYEDLALNVWGLEFALIYAEDRL